MFRPSPRFSNLRSTANAFSLVEVVLAIGLATFALLVIFSIMPVGLGILQSASRQIVETEIYNTVGAELTSTPFSEIDKYCDTRFPAYFDVEGLEVPASQAVFTVRCSAESPEVEGQLRRAKVRIGFHQDPVATATPKPSTRTFLVVDRGI